MLSKGQELDNGDSIGQTLLGIHSASLQCGDPVNGNRFPSFNLNVINIQIIVFSLKIYLI